MHSSNHTLLPELKPTVITEVGALITTPLPDIHTQL